MRKHLSLILCLLLLTATLSRGAFEEITSGSGGGDLTATYLLQTADALLPNAQVLGSLASGCLSVTHTTGVVASSGAACGSGGLGTVTHTVGPLTLNALVVGNASADIDVLASLGTTTTLLHGNAAGRPTFSAVVSADLNITTTSCTNQVVSAISAGGVGTCHTIVAADTTGLGTVTSIGTTSPITGGAITATGTIACATCVTSAAALTLNAPVIGQGLQATAVGSVSGNTTTFATTTGAFTSGNCVKTDASHNFVDNGAVCGGGGGGATSLDAITAAVANQTGILNADFNIVWKWAKTTDSTIAFNFTESTAATGGTSTSGKPNQVLAKFSTLAASTMSPIQITVRGTYMCSASTTVSQWLCANGNSTNPMYGFAASTTTGMYFDGTYLQLTKGGNNLLAMDTTHLYVYSGAATEPGLTDWVNSSTGFSWFAPRIMAIIDGQSGDGEWIRFFSRTTQFSSAKADAVAYALNARKSRGTVASPTVITTGDAGLTESAFYFVGATNTYQEASRIEHDSTGTISDATNGVGGIVKIMTKLQGTDTAVQTNLTIQGGSNGYITLSAVAFANLPTPSAGSMLWCNNCDAPTLINATCTSVGGKTGSLALYDGSNWKCFT